MYGIDQTLEQTADAYRGNPQMLQQKYAQNQNLIDLLALQKLKSEKESAQREMQLKMGGKPPTVADQREQQVLDMTKQEVVQEQAGVMQNKMREQQEAQKRLMQAAGAPQPQAGGIMNAMPQRPPSAGISGAAAPNMQRMASGGIVAFNGATGSAVDGNQGEEEAQRAYAARRQNQPPRETPRVNLTPEERAAKERQIQERTAFDRDAELTNFLLGMAGRSTPGLAIAAGGAAAQNARNQALAARQKAEGELIDIGPESRKTGFKAGESAYGPSMQGLASGVQSAANMAATGEAAASRAQIAREAELGRAETRANQLHRTILESVQNDPAYKKAAEALVLANQLAITGRPDAVARRDAEQRSLNQLYQSLYNMHRGLMNPNAAGSAPPTTTTPPGPPTVPFGSLPPRP